MTSNPEVIPVGWKTRYPQKWPRSLRHSSRLVGQAETIQLPRRGLDLVLRSRLVGSALRAWHRLWAATGHSEGIPSDDVLVAEPIPPELGSIFDEVFAGKDLGKKSDSSNAR